MHEIRTRSLGRNAVTAEPTASMTPGAFVSEDAPGHDRGHMALQDVQIGTADRGLGDLHDRVAYRLKLGLRPVPPALSCPGRDRRAPS
jgi:hypothetical protein